MAIAAILTDCSVCTVAVIVVVFPVAKLRLPDYPACFEEMAVKADCSVCTVAATQVALAVYGQVRVGKWVLKDSCWIVE